MKYVTSVIVIILVIGLVVFGLQNTTAIPIQFLSLHTGALPLFVTIFVSALIGMAVVGLLSVPGRIQRRIETRRTRQHIADLEQQVADLKELVPPPVMKPLPGEHV